MLPDSDPDRHFLIQIQIKIQYSQMNADPCGFGSRSTTLQKTFLIRCKSGSKSTTLQSIIFSFWISDLRSRGQYGTRSRIWICNAESKRILVFLTQKLWLSSHNYGTGSGRIFSILDPRTRGQKCTVSCIPDLIPGSRSEPMDKYFWHFY
jgi:hypothetical protein